MVNISKLSTSARIDLAMRWYFDNATGPYSGGRPAQPGVMDSYMEEDGTVTLRNKYHVLAKVRVNDDGEIEELDFDPWAAEEK